ncbi:benzaldehyde dehydrogenase [Sciscionella marina]|uniref:benzaldehyde dehydrogenase n=1 Tax=Sciscionella marina TaxID=508770 RepID=UPI000382F018|nr:benzaldehyde dehydrogenase [Sciscionella marina]
MTLLDTVSAENWQGRVYTGDWTPARTTAPVREPATGAELGSIGIADRADVGHSAEIAAAAQRDWAARPFQERAEILRTAGRLWQEHAAELREWLIRESGSIEDKANFELHIAAQECFEAAALPSRALGQILPSEAPRLSMTRRIPAGVVGVIAPFNAPLILSIRSVAPALALGNSVVLKPDPRTAVCGGVALARIFAEAGVPEGVLHVLPGGAETGAALVADPNVRVISYTGSTAAGRAVGEAAGRHLKRAHLELGGNSALIVLADADLEHAVTAACRGAYFHQGQICMATGRHLVHESLYGEYTERLAERAAALTVGDPFRGKADLGPIIDAAQRDKIHGIVTASIEAGARAVTGAQHEGPYYRPTVLAGATPGIPAYDNEIFGPVAPVAPFGSIEEAAGLAAASEYGLALGILTPDLDKGLALADRIPTGIAHINDQTINDEAVAPFGGLGASGTGSRFGGPEANVDAFTETRWITLRGAAAAHQRR